MTPRTIVVIGASTGGIDALKTLLAALPPTFAAAIFVVVHVAPDSPGILPAILDQAGPLPVRRAEDGMVIAPGQVYVAQAEFYGG